MVLKRKTDQSALEINQLLSIVTIESRSFGLFRLSLLAAYAIFKCLWSYPRTVSTGHGALETTLCAVAIGK